ncbi:hypothetical protein AB1E18_017323 [Capra hircus]
MLLPPSGGKGEDTSPGALVVKSPPVSAGDVRDVGQTPGVGRWDPTPVFLPGESHGQRSLAGYCLWGHKELDTTEATLHTWRGRGLLLLALERLYMKPLSIL